MTQREVQALKARVRATWDAMNAARVDYIQAQLDLKTLLGDSQACDRLSRQLRNLLNAERPKRTKQTARKGSVGPESERFSSGNRQESDSVLINRNAADAVARGEEVSQ